MKTINTAPLSGMQELLPEKQEIFEGLKNKIEQIYKHHGFWKIETPTIERREILLAKAGGETEKQIYFVSKRDSEEAADEALRFDHTVPLARYVVEHSNDLTFPFKVTQVGRNFRGERAQKGRFREFYQCDVDILGRDTLPISYDAEVIAVLARALEVFGLPDLVVRINNRKILAGFLQSLDLTAKTSLVSGIIDKSEKVTEEETKSSLAELDIPVEKIAKILAFIQIKGGSSELFSQMSALGVKNDLFDEGLSEIITVLNILEKQNLPVKARGDMMIVRGLDYYTGTVFEVFVDGDRSLGSLCGGGRYEDLTMNFSAQKFVGVGGSIGLTRLFSVLDRKGLVKPLENRNPHLAVIPLSDNEIEFAAKVADEKRAAGFVVDLVLMDKKLSDKLKYAARVAEQAIVIGEAEAKTGKYELRDLN